MSNPTTPFSWQMPTATDLVTDLPADFEVFGQAVATSMADLLGGTTGQVLAKNSATDMDFVWTTSTSGSLTLLSTTTLSASTTTVSSISQAYKHLFIEIRGIDTSNFNPTINYQTNSTGFVFNVTQAASPSAGVTYYNTNGTVGNAQNYGGSQPYNSAAIWIYNYTDAVQKKVGSFNQFWVNEGGSPIYFNGQLLANHTAALTSFSMTVSTGSYDAGTIKVYGVN